MHDDQTNYTDQLAVHRRCSPLIHCHGFHSIQLQCCLRPYCVTTTPIFLSVSLLAISLSNMSCSGIFVYTVLNGLIGLVVLISGGRLEPREYDLKEYWTWKTQGQPPWFVRAIQLRRNHGETPVVSGRPEHKSPLHVNHRFIDAREIPCVKTGAISDPEQPILGGGSSCLGSQRTE